MVRNVTFVQSGVPVIMSPFICNQSNRPKRHRMCIYYYVQLPLPQAVNAAAGRQQAQ